MRMKRRASFVGENKLVRETTSRPIAELSKGKGTRLDMLLVFNHRRRVTFLRDPVRLAIQDD